jgi:hypothetical protein
MGPEAPESVEGNKTGRLVYTLQAAFERGTFAKDIVIKKVFLLPFCFLFLIKRIRVIRVAAPGMDFTQSQVCIMENAISS